ncbi:hypothetical protein PHMEG_00026902 [Phytophthora megakarya]|uniref:Uncharacterized protein n=1 Tax=Phytophthora megakarya TaxID=4795 RepID=A0A225V8G4_9STRA|nr:hypothetical protein PHMEG_00026902 [Phytophthora megakarya]
MELQLDTREWMYLLPVIQANLNHMPVSSLNNRMPSEIFTLLPFPNSLTSVVVPRPRKDIVLDVVSGLENVEDSVNRCMQYIRRWWRARRRDGAKISAGHLERRVTSQKSRIDSRLSKNKLLVRWVGPFEVTEALPHSIKVCHVVKNKIYNVHDSRLKCFADLSLDVTEELIAHVGNQGMVLEIEEFKVHRFEKNTQRVATWNGSLSAMAKEVPVKVSEYIGGTSDSAIKTELPAIIARHPHCG